MGDKTPRMGEQTKPERSKPENPSGKEAVSVIPPILTKL